MPGLTAELISKHLPKKPCDSKRSCQAFPKKGQVIPPKYPTPDLPVTSDLRQETVTTTKTIHIAVVEPSDLLATDLTGRLPTISSRGYNYIIVCYIYDINGIIVCPMKNALLLNISEYTKRSFATCRSRASVQMSKRWTTNVPKS